MNHRLLLGVALLITASSQSLAQQPDGSCCPPTANGWKADSWSSNYGNPNVWSGVYPPTDSWITAPTYGLATGEPAGSQGAGAAGANTADYLGRASRPPDPTVFKPFPHHPYHPVGYYPTSWWHHILGGDLLTCGRQRWVGAYFKPIWQFNCCGLACGRKSCGGLICAGCQGLPPGAECYPAYPAATYPADAACPSDLPDGPRIPMQYGYPQAPPLPSGAPLGRAPTSEANWWTKMTASLTPWRSER